MTKRESQLANIPFFKRQWILFLARATPDCDRIVKMASDSLERPLTLKERLQMKMHFWICNLCERYFAQIQWMHRCACKLHEHPEHKLTLALSSEEKQQLKAALRGEKS